MEQSDVVKYGRELIKLRVDMSNVEVLVENHYPWDLHVAEWMDLMDVRLARIEESS